jgi:hypothetical protein
MLFFVLFVEIQNTERQFPIEYTVLPNGHPEFTKATTPLASLYSQNSENLEYLNSPKK